MRGVNTLEEKILGLLKKFQTDLNETEQALDKATEKYLKHTDDLDARDAVRLLMGQITAYECIVRQLERLKNDFSKD